MKVFLDANVIIELLLDRKFADKVQLIAEAVDNGSIEACTSASAFCTIIYYTDLGLKAQRMTKAKRIEVLRTIMGVVLDRFDIVAQGRADMESGITDRHFTDLEDSCQYQAACKAGCDYLITINTKDFNKAQGKTKVVSLLDFVEIFLTHNRARKH